MVDDGKLHYRRSADAYAAPEPSHGTGYDQSRDPLAELARMIGQHDLLAGLGQKPGANDQARSTTIDDRPVEQATYARGRPFDEPPAQLPPATFGYGSHRGPDDPHGRVPEAYGHYRDQPTYQDQPAFEGRAGYQDRAYAEPDDAGYGRHAQDTRIYDERAYDERAYDERAYDERAASPLNSYDQHAPYADGRDGGQYRETDGDHRSGGEDWRYGSEPAAASEPETIGYTPRHAADRQAAQDDGREHWQSEAAPGIYEEGTAYEQPTPRRARGGLATVIGVLGLAVLGTAGAFAYRSYFSAPSANPPIIRADAAPNKIVPSRASEPVSRRTEGPAERSQPERVVSREEQPIQLSETPPATLPRVIPTTRSAAPAAGSRQPSDLGSSANASAAGPPGQTGSTEPKRVRTVTIRPAAPEAETAASARAARATAAAGPAATRSTASTPNSPFPPPAPAASAPLALGSQPASALPPAPPVRQASRQPGSDQGGFFVQISAQKSEEEAQSSFRSIQSRFPGLLGNRDVVIRKKDLGARGIYYGAQIGPFAGREEANSLCENLKSQGGTCIVQRN